MNVGMNEPQAQQVPELLNMAEAFQYQIDELRDIKNQIQSALNRMMSDPPQPENKDFCGPVAPNVSPATFLDIYNFQKDQVQSIKNELYALSQKLKIII